MLESTLQRNIRKYLSREKIYNLKYHSCEYTEKGVPDILCCMDGKFIAFEIKRKGKKNTETIYQQLQSENIKKSNGLCFLVDSIEEVENIIKKLRRYDDE